MINRTPSLNGHHDPAELEKKKMMRELRKKARKSQYLWFGVFFGVALFLSLLALIIFIVAISK